MRRRALTGAPTATAVWLGRGDAPAAEFSTRSLDEAAAWLDQAAREHYPDSDYTKRG